MKQQADQIIGQPYEWLNYPGRVNYLADKAVAHMRRIVVTTEEELIDYQLYERAIKITGTANPKELNKKLRNRQLHTIPRLIVVLTPKCTLRCKECNNLMWKFEHSDELDISKTIHALKNIVKVLDFIPCVELIGGEPFLASGLKQALEYVTSEEKILKVEITTNATIIPKDDEVVRLLKCEKVIVRVSDYSMVVKQDKFIDYMNENQIKCELLQFNFWTATGGSRKRRRETSSLIQQYYNCISGVICKTLWENQIYPCARAASLAQLNIMDDCPNILVDDNNAKLTEQLQNFLIAPTCGACDYCDMALENSVPVPPAEQW